MTGIIGKDLQVKSGKFGFPSDHVIQRKKIFNVNNQPSHIETSSTDFVSTGVYGDFTPRHSNAVTYLKLEWFVGRFEHYGKALSNTVTMTTVAGDTTTYSTSNDIFDTSSTYRWYGYDTSSTGHHAYFEAYIAGWSGGVKAWSAGTEYRFRIYHKSSSGNAISVHSGCQAQLHALEIMI